MFYPFSDGGSRLGSSFLIEIPDSDWSAGVFMQDFFIRVGINSCTRHRSPALNMSRFPMNFSELVVTESVCLPYSVVSFSENYAIPKGPAMNGIG
jgi:hypothetical protein